MNLIFIYGPPAAGKLTVASELVKLTNYKLLDNHKAIDYLSELFPRSDDQRIESIRGRLGRKIRLDIFEAAATAGTDLITTFAPLAPGTHDFMRQAKERVENVGGKVIFIQLLPSRNCLLERVAEESRIGKKLDDPERWIEVVGSNSLAFETYPDVEHLVLDNSSIPAADAAKDIAKYHSL